MVARPRAIVLLAVTVGLLVSVTAAAQDAPKEKPERTESDALVEELLRAEGGNEDDLGWVYSNRDEYSPSGLVGEPVPLDELPETGEGSRRKWDPRWRRFSVGNYILTGASLAIAASSALISPASSPWRRRNSFDEGVRDGIGIHDFERGQWARDLSDVTISIAISYPLIFDSVVVLYWYRRSPDVAQETVLISGETMAFAAALQGVSAGLTSRERPYGRNCGDSIDPELDVCVEKKRYRSFYSGHTALAFAGAGASCTNHFYHRLFGSPVADGIACGGAFAIAATTGTMRIVGDQHYASDVGTGAVLGTLTGLGLPWLLHYGPLAQPDSAVRMRVAPVGSGLGVEGEF